MASSPVVRNGFLSAEVLNNSPTTSPHRRSASSTRSMRSTRSRITLIEDNPELTDYQDPKVQDSYKVVTYKQPKYTWVDHLLGVMCFDVSNRKKPVVLEEFVKPEVPQTPEEDPDSPWVLPVFVLSTRTDSSKHHVPKVAKCTIDTGNRQGNIVSREFVMDVLEYSEANICDLTKEEKDGGVGVTGDRLIPEGAIYLTWYHKKSSRVFRNMRFLISPNQHYDLIIGARSIMKDRLLDVPNLMAEGGTSRLTRVVVPEGKVVDGTWDFLRTKKHHFEHARLTTDGKLDRAKKYKVAGEITKFTKQLVEEEKNFALYTKAFRIYSLKHHKIWRAELLKTFSEEEIDQYIKDLEEEQKELDGFHELQLPEELKKGATSSSSGANATHGAQTVQRKQPPGGGASHAGSKLMTGN